MPHWKIVTDGSLNDYSRGVELVSPPLVGENGLKQIEIVAKALHDLGCSVSKRCGLHVHVGVSDVATSPAGMAFFKKLVKLYSSYEPVIDSLVPASRRGNANNYCRSLTSTPASVIDSAMNFDSLFRVVTASAPDDHSRRFFKVNLAAYRKYKTVEFRQHSGTLDAEKVRRWTVFCLRMVEAAKGELPSVGSAPPQNNARPGSKAHLIGEMLLRPEGVTGREICARLGWPSVSIPAQAKAAGITVTAQRTGREVRYFATNTASTEIAAAPITVDGFAAVIGATEEEKAFMTQRAADLSGPIAWQI